MNTRLIFLCLSLIALAEYLHRLQSPYVKIRCSGGDLRVEAPMWKENVN